jgi:hypothetical protein
MTTNEIINKYTRLSVIQYIKRETRSRKQPACRSCGGPVSRRVKVCKECKLLERHDPCVMPVNQAVVIEDRIRDLFRRREALRRGW